MPRMIVLDIYHWLRLPFRRWHPHAYENLLVHMDSLVHPMLLGRREAVLEYLIAVKFCEDCLRERPDMEEARALQQRIFNDLNALWDSIVALTTHEHIQSQLVQLSEKIEHRALRLAAPQGP